MPLYEYECTSCHRRTEKIQKYSDADLTVCPHCGGPLERTITAAAISFKGGGWYKDGYASAKPDAPAKGGDSDGVLELFAEFAERTREFHGLHHNVIG